MPKILTFFFADGVLQVIIRSHAPNLSLLTSYSNSDTKISLKIFLETCSQNPKSLKAFGFGLIMFYRPYVKLFSCRAMSLVFFCC